MRPTNYGLAAIAIAVVGVYSIPLDTPGPDDVLASTALDNVYKVLAGTLSDGSPKANCTKDNVRHRKE
jgi:tyrosinase